MSSRGSDRQRTDNEMRMIRKNSLEKEIAFCGCGFLFAYSKLEIFALSPGKQTASSLDP
jgi:hypothetical protein